MRGRLPLRFPLPECGRSSEAFQDAHHQRTGGGRRRPDSRTGAIPVRKRSGTAFADRPKSPAADKPEIKN